MLKCLKNILQTKPHGSSKLSMWYGPILAPFPSVNDFAIEYPAHGQKRASNELRKRGIFVSPAGIRSIWLRSNLETMKKRLVALTKRSAEEGLVLTEAQVTALERKKDDDIACGEIETAHPGYLGSQDTFYVGCLKGVDRIYQQTFVDTYSKVAVCKLYTSKTPITAADLLNDRVYRSSMSTRHQCYE